MKILTIFGTRPEAIKMAPLIKLFEKDQDIESLICVTGQHREMLDQVLELFEIKPDFDLSIMKESQTLAHITSEVLTGVSKIIEQVKPNHIFVHGDVTTGLAASLAAFYHKIPVSHIEAGLRTGNIYSPYPEEMNRKLIANLATFHFSPTQTAKNNLLKENIPQEQIIVTGNTVIDALYWVKNKIENDIHLNTHFSKKFNFLDNRKKLILVTGHRRENFEGGIERVCKTLKKMVGEHSDIQILYPVHLNPHVQKTTETILSNSKDIFLIEPQDYLPFVYLMNRAYLIITDSGGIQEEAPSLGKPVLVTRDTTERPEAVEAGTVKLVGTNPELLEKEIKLLLNDKEAYRKMQRTHNPYGDGKACEKILDAIKKQSF